MSVFLPLLLDSSRPAAEDLLAGAGAGGAGHLEGREVEIVRVITLQPTQL
mgnify:CR=1 FL=1